MQPDMPQSRSMVRSTVKRAAQTLGITSPATRALHRLKQGARRVRHWPMQRFRQRFPLTYRYTRSWARLIIYDPTHIPHKLTRALRFFDLWIRFPPKVRNPLDDQVPWIGFEAFEYVERLLRPDWHIFEYGTGGSTLFYAHRVQQVVSVEHDAEWYGHVVTALQQHGLTNATCHLIEPEFGTAGDGSAANPTAYGSIVAPYEQDTFYHYATFINTFPDNSFDFVVVDGRSRPACLFHAHTRVKPGGYLMLDNSDRPHYQQVKALLDSWEPVVFAGPVPYSRNFTETTVWKKPVA